MVKKSAGILFYRFHKNLPEVLLVHPGGLFWSKKDQGAWSIPKGEFAEDESPLDAAKREVKEELGINASGNFIELTPVKQKSGKVIYAWALESDFDTATIKSNLFEIEWPPNSGEKKSFPEVDKAAWLSIEEAKEKINLGQVQLIEELRKKVSSFSLKS